jgi:hypothetical protein
MIKDTPATKRLILEVDRSAELRREVRKANLENRELRERELEMRRLNRTLKRQLDQTMANEQEMRARELSQLKEAITAQFNGQFSEYRRQIEGDRTVLADEYTTKLKVSRNE